MLLCTKTIASLAFVLARFAHSLPDGFASSDVSPRSNSGGLSDIVTWDANSFFVRGERIFLWSGEFHPFRLNSPGLWLDVFQKIKALGYSAVSFYLDWALLEGEPGHFRAQGIFNPGPFMEAAGRAGIYLIARPGPYINAEVSGGGLPGWLARIEGVLRSADSAYLEPALEYERNVARLIEPYLVSNGGPVILYQIENEYSLAGSSIEDILNAGPDQYNGLSRQYMADLQDAVRNEGIVIPMDHNDAFPRGLWASGQGEGAVDIYANDDYPFSYGSSCIKPTFVDHWGGQRLISSQARILTIGRQVLFHSLPSIVHDMSSSPRAIRSVSQNFKAATHRAGE